MFYLLEFMVEMDGQDWITNDWDDSGDEDPNYCKWHGITCNDNDHVIVLHYVIMDCMVQQDMAYIPYLN